MWHKNYIYIYIKTIIKSRSWHKPVIYIYIYSHFCWNVFFKVWTQYTVKLQSVIVFSDFLLMNSYIYIYIFICILLIRCVHEVISTSIVCHSDCVLQFVTWVSSISLPFRSLFCRLLLPKRKLFINRLQAIHLLSLLHLRLWLTSFKQHLNLHSHFSFFFFIYIYICVYGLAYAFHVESERYIYIYLNI